jgi:hypothetical protein
VVIATKYILMLGLFQNPRTSTFTDAIIFTHEVKEFSGVEPHIQSQQQVHCEENAAKEI